MKKDLNCTELKTGLRLILNNELISTQFPTQGGTNDFSYFEPKLRAGKDKALILV